MSQLTLAQCKVDQASCRIFITDVSKHLVTVQSLRSHSVLVRQRIIAGPLVNEFYGVVYNLSYSVLFSLTNGHNIIEC